MLSEPLFLGIDFGSSTFKAGLYTETGKLRGIGRSELDLDVRNYEDGRFELSAPAFWNHVKACVEAAFAEAGATASCVLGVSYASQANSFILLDRSDNPLSSIIMWTDRRGATLLDRCNSGWEGSELLSNLGIDSFIPEMAVTKLMWYQEVSPKIWSRVSKIQTLSDYFVYRVTGNRVGDMGTASLTGLWNQKTKDWWPEALSKFGVDSRTLSNPLNPGTIAGGSNDFAHRRLGLIKGTPVHVGSLDHHVGAIAPLMSYGADVSISLGTVVAATLLGDRYQPQPGVVTGPDFAKGYYYRLAFSNFGASWIKRLKDEKCHDISWDQFFLEGRSALSNGLADLKVDVDESLKYNKFIFNHLLPHHSTAHFTAAVLSAVSSQIKELVSRTFGQRTPKLVCLCGGGTQNKIWEDLLEATLGTECRSLPGMEFGCLGAALLAAAGSRMEDVWSIAESIDPDELGNYDDAAHQ